MDADQGRGSVRHSHLDYHHMKSFAAGPAPTEGHRPEAVRSPDQAATRKHNLMQEILAAATTGEHCLTWL
jgi:hypothetical protein